MIINTRVSTIMHDADRCPLKLLQVGHTTVFSRQCKTENGIRTYIFGHLSMCVNAAFPSHVDKWENIFMATIQITNTAEEKLDVSAVRGEYLSEGEINCSIPNFRPCSIIMSKNSLEAHFMSVFMFTSPVR